MSVAGLKKQFHKASQVSGGHCPPVCMLAPGCGVVRCNVLKCFAITTDYVIMA